ncbi:MAG: hypothetical protein R3236_01010 [Phycisphaeraceae bacterium]|nr:hypothetical protein [Phycisphaeraceae bacterium]
MELRPEASTDHATLVHTLKAFAYASTGIVVLVLCVVCFYVVRSRAVYEKIFMDFDVELPTMTKAFLALNGPAFYGTTGLLVAGLVGKDVLFRNVPLVSLGVNGFCLIGTLAVYFFFQHAMTLPLMRLIVDLC